MNIPPKTRKSVTLANCSSSFSDCPGRKFRVYLKHSFYVSSGDNSEIKPAFTKYGAKHTKGSSTGILSPSMSELPGYKQHRRGFLKNETTSSKEYAKKDIVYIGDFCILNSANSTDSRSFQMWLQ